MISINKVMGLLFLSVMGGAQLFAAEEAPAMLTLQVPEGHTWQIQTKDDASRIILRSGRKSVGQFMKEVCSQSELSLVVLKGGDVVHTIDDLTLFTRIACDEWAIVAQSKGDEAVEYFLQPIATQSAGSSSRWSVIGSAWNNLDARQLAGTTQSFLYGAIAAVEVAREFKEGANQGGRIDGALDAAELAADFAALRRDPRQTRKERRKPACRRFADDYCGGCDVQ